MRNKFIRTITGFLGRVGRMLHLAHLPFLISLYNVLAKRVVPRKDVEILIDGQSLLIPNPHENTIGRMLYLHGYWEKDVSLFLCSRIREGMSVMDVGAHIGYYTILMAKRVGRSGRVVSFEPNPVVRRYLRQNVARNQYANVAISEFALFDKEGNGNLVERADLNSYLQARVHTDGGGEIRLRPLDSFFGDFHLSRLDLIKMDIEGAEWNALLGMRGTLAEFSPELIIEVHPEALRANETSEDKLLALLASWKYAARVICQVDATKTIFCSPRR